MRPWIFLSSARLHALLITFYLAEVGRKLSETMTVLPPPPLSTIKKKKKDGDLLSNIVLTQLPASMLWNWWTCFHVQVRLHDYRDLFFITAFREIQVRSSVQQSGSSQRHAGRRQSQTCECFFFFLDTFMSTVCTNYWESVFNVLGKK